MSVDSRSPYRLTVGQRVNPYVGLHFTYMAASVSANTQLQVDMLAVTGRPSDDTGSVNCRWNIGRLSVEHRLTISVISVDCHLKYKLGSWVSALRARYCGSGV